MGSEQIENEDDLLYSGTAQNAVSLDIITPEHTRKTIPGQFLLFGGKSLLVNTTERISSSTFLAAQHNDVLLIGEVCACEETDRLWIIRINVKYTLTNLQSLIRLRSALLGSAGQDLELEYASASRRDSFPVALLHQ